MDRFIERVCLELLPGSCLESVDPHDPVVVHSLPRPWSVLGRGNYAAVVIHPDHPDLVVKPYAPGREGWEEEVEVYRRLGRHPAYSECLHSNGDCRMLILRRLYGMTLYECVLHGVRIPEQAIRDVDGALDYARSLGLRPHDVHGKNVILSAEGRGVVVDVSDFLKEEPCYMWHDLKRAYYRVYLPYMHDRPVAVHPVLLDGLRTGYRLMRHRRRRWGSSS